MPSGSNQVISRLILHQLDRESRTGSEWQDKLPVESEKKISGFYKFLVVDGIDFPAVFNDYRFWTLKGF